MRGGKRKGAGRKKGSSSRSKLQLEVEAQTAGEKVTAAERMRAMKRQVALCTADGMAPEKIAAIMGLSVEKLRAVFGHELEHGREIIRADELVRLDAASADGKVAASKIILQTAGADRPPDSKPTSDKNDNAKITRMALSVLNGGKK